MLLLLLLVLGDTALAGAAYREGVEALEQGRAAEAAEKFQVALRHESRETGSLQFRDRSGRHTIAYFPHYDRARALLRLADGADGADRGQELLRQAAVHLEMTRHPGAAEMLEKVRTRLDDFRGAPEDSRVPAIAGLRRTLETLCAQKRFEDAARAIGAEAALLEGRESDRKSLEALVAGRRQAALDALSEILALGLESVVALDPAGPVDAPLALLRPALVPPAVCAAPPEPFRWLRSFLTLYEELLPRVREAGALQVAETVRIAERFEESAEAALAAGSWAGYRAARHAACALRLARMTAIPVARVSEARALMESAERSSRRCEEFLAKAGPAGETAPYLERDRTQQVRRVTDLGLRLEQRAGREARVAEAAEQARAALADPARMADRDALQQAGEALDLVEREVRSEEVGEEMRARLHFMQALVRATHGLLDGDPDARLSERCQETLARAYALDPHVDRPWRHTLSPKLLALFDSLKPR